MLQLPFVFSLSLVDKVSSPITPSGYNELFTSSHGSSSSSTYSRQRAQNTHLQHNNTDYSAEQVRVQGYV